MLDNLKIVKSRREQVIMDQIHAKKTICPYGCVQEIGVNWSLISADETWLFNQVVTPPFTFFQPGLGQGLTTIKKNLSLTKT